MREIDGNSLVNKQYCRLVTIVGSDMAFVEAGLHVHATNAILSNCNLEQTCLLTLVTPHASAWGVTAF